MWVKTAKSCLPAITRFFVFFADPIVLALGSAPRKSELNKAVGWTSSNDLLGFLSGDLLSWLEGEGGGGVDARHRSRSSGLLQANCPRL